jgi:ATP-dependent Clp protease ATP-binding subunit ClpA
MEKIVHIKRIAQPAPTLLSATTQAKQQPIIITAIYSMTDTKEVSDMAIDGKSDKKPLPSGYQIPWVEKYRPKTLDDVVGNEETVQRLRAIAQTGNLPNLILAGPPGTGKTTSVHALARQLLGSSYKDAVLELNASDARGIDVSSTS